ncbi:restriction endonuclease subunit S [Glycocaulis sp.]|uniref:restriction endonuclease subunit S n=1 Tax=Glycocaulis sp. TaxID=1969725 RepID=UPI0025BA397D|nr:restriction endonuclease subunit S [Glycocaulis sp.]MCH8522830.1 restriction endonuclease subunit S [Glycocaulis sp.]
MTIVALAEIADQIRGVSYGKTDVVDRPAEGFLPVLRANNITDDGLSFDDLVYVRAEKVSAKQQVRSGDIVIAASSGSISVVGKAAQAEHDLGMGFGAFCKVVRPSPKVHARYIGHFFKTQGYRRRMSALAAGANINNLKNEHIDEIEIPLPTLDEQKRIAAILDQADVLRRKRQRAIDRLNQLGQAIFYEMFGDLAQLPRTQDFANVATIQKSLVDPKLPEFRSELHVGPEHIASGSGAIEWRSVRTIEEDNVISGKNRFSEGDIIYSKIRPYLNKVALADRAGLCSADMYVIQPTKGKANAEFLRTLLMGKDFLAYAETCSNRANIPKLNRRQVEGYIFNCPPLQEQNEFARRLHKVAGDPAP